jgi:L-asparaginase II
VDLALLVGQHPSGELADVREAAVADLGAADRDAGAVACQHHIPAEPA